jgi:hypothetical protein
LSNLVWQVGYYTYKDAGARNFEEMAIEYENAPDLRLALWNIEEKVKNYK